MKHLSLVFAIVCLTAFVSQAARQKPTTQQRLHFKIGIPPGKQPVLLLPHGGHTVELSALTMDRDETSVHLKGAAEIRLAINRIGTVLLQTDEAVYDLNTAEIEARGTMRMTLEKSR